MTATQLHVQRVRPSVSGGSGSEPEVEVTLRGGSALLGSRYPVSIRWETPLRGVTSDVRIEIVRAGRTDSVEVNGMGLHGEGPTSRTVDVRVGDTVVLDEIVINIEGM